MKSSSNLGNTGREEGTTWDSLSAFFVFVLIRHMIVNHSIN